MGKHDEQSRKGNTRADIENQELATAPSLAICWLRLHLRWALQVGAVRSLVRELGSHTLLNAAKINK